MFRYELFERRLCVVEAPPETALPARHRVLAEVRRAERDVGRFVARQSEMIDPVASKRDLEQCAGEAGALVDERKQAARGDVEAAQRSAQIADRLAHEPVPSKRVEPRIHRENGLKLAFRLHQPHADVELAGAHR